MENSLLLGFHLKDKLECRMRRRSLKCKHNKKIKLLIGGKKAALTSQTQKNTAKI